MQKFIIGTTNFETGEITYHINKAEGVIDELTIQGSDSIFSRLTQNANGRWGHALYPPRLYFHNLPVIHKNNKVYCSVNQELPSDAEAALYLMEHSNITGNFIIDDNNIFSFEGAVTLYGKTEPLLLEVNLNA